MHGGDGGGIDGYNDGGRDDSGDICGVDESRGCGDRDAFEDDSGGRTLMQKLLLKVMRIKVMMAMKKKTMRNMNNGST